MSRFIVAVEYSGPDLPPGTPGRRRPVVRHAYEVETGVLAHGPDGVRVGFTSPDRGWPSSHGRPRCSACAVAVDASVSVAIAAVLDRRFRNSRAAGCDLLRSAVSNEEKAAKARHIRRSKENHE